MEVQYFINQQKYGYVFAKISKSKNCQGKGANVDYSKFYGLIYSEKISNMTFEPIEIIFEFLHYGDMITIIEFNESDNEILDAKIFESLSNKGCFNTNKYRIGKTLKINSIDAISFIFSNVKNIDAFKDVLLNYEDCICENLSDNVREVFLDRANDLFGVGCIEKISIKERLNGIEIDEIERILKKNLIKIYTKRKWFNIFDEVKNYKISNQIKRYQEDEIKDIYVDKDDIKKVNELIDSIANGEKKISMLERLRLIFKKDKR